MRRKYLQLVVTFATTTAAMEMEQRAEKAEISGRLIPLPSEKTELSEKDTIMNFMEQQKLHWEAMYELLMF